MIPKEYKTFGFQWHLTDLCNGRCRHCYQESFHRGDELSLDMQKSIADDIFAHLAKRKISVNVTGGEPMLLDKLPEFTEHLAGKDNLDELWIITNGTVANKKLLDRLGALSQLTGFKVSMEAADVSINDHIRWPGHLDSLSKNMDSLLAQDKSVVIMVTLGKHNLKQVGPIVEWARKMGCSGVMFERFIPMGNGLGMMEQALDLHQWLEACKEIGDQADQVLDRLETSIYKAYWISFDADGDLLRGALCNLGDESMALMPDGTVFPCRRLPLSMGNIVTSPFEKILQKLSSFSAGNIRSRLVGTACKSCGLEQCAGCRALPMALYGDFLADDPLCKGPIGVQ